MSRILNGGHRVRCPVKTTNAKHRFLQPVLPLLGDILSRIDRLGFCLLVTGVCSLVLIGGARPASAEEPTREACEAAVAEARGLAATFPADDISRYFAERHLHQALVEAGNGEFDDCLEAVERATVELREHRHALKPGERLNVLQANELPPR
ncbi:hypothetical protein [Bradyrhizobium sp. STM 3843]|uniref:hypothetical protein n=1 Tax=Bradyrhizobium sp. STM 3843 TaxID=551947 RepID=UPI00268C8C55